MLAESGNPVNRAIATYLFRDEGNGYAESMIDLYSASRDDLIRLVIAMLASSVAQLTQRVGELLVAQE
jgi:hypothetical protein